MFYLQLLRAVRSETAIREMFEVRGFFFLKISERYRNIAYVTNEYVENVDNRISPANVASVWF